MNEKERKEQLKTKLHQMRLPN